MKLELKHLAPYLPYGLRMLNTKSGRVIDVRGLRATVSEFIIEATVKSDNGINDVEYQSDLWPLKPILRPLVKGSHHHIGLSDYDYSVIANWLYNKELSIPLLERLSYNGTSLLLSNHYDVFGLIDAGLAIDLNSIN